MNTYPLLLIKPMLALVSILIPLSHSSTVYMNENFTEADRLVQDLPSSTAWYSGTSSAHVHQDVIDGSLTMFSADSSSRHVLAYLTEEGQAPIGLEVGETLLVDFEVTLSNPVLDGTSNSFRMGLFDSRLADTSVQRISMDEMGGVSPTNIPSYFDSYVGYRFDSVLHTNTSVGAVRAFRRNPGSSGNALLMLTTAYSGEIAAGGTLSEFPTGIYHGEVRITRNDGGTVNFSYRLYSDDSLVAIDNRLQGIDSSANAVFSFDTIAFGLNSRVAESFRLHQVTVSVEEADVNEFMVGTRPVETTKFTPGGIPVVPMWDAPMPTNDRRNGAGFPVLTDAEHAIVWQPANRDEGAYNHYATLINFEGRFFAMWGNHPLGEDGPGQRIMYAYSDEWGNWSSAEDLFEAPGPVLPRTESGIHLKPDRWMVIDGKLYAVVYVFQAGNYSIARQVNFDGSYENPFYVNQPPGGETVFPSFMEGVEPPAGSNITAAQIRVWYSQNSQVSWWGRTDQSLPRFGIDGATIIETFAYRAKDGGMVLMGRNWGTPSNPVHNNRMYVTFKNDSGPWESFYPTDIPDSPSRAEALTLSDGTVLLIGNQNVSRFDDALYLDRDPITVSISEDGYTFDRVFALRTQARTSYRFTGIAGRNHGYAYSMSIVHDGWLYTMYSASKEDLEITRVRLSDMDLFPAEEEALLFDDAEATYNGWRYSPWLGHVALEDYPHIYSANHGWLYVSEDSSRKPMLYHFGFGWFYTDSVVFPYLHVYSNNSWYRYLHGMGNSESFIKLPENETVTVEQVGQI